MTEPLKLNLPKEVEKDSADQTKRFFNTYFNAPLSFSANEVDAVLGFFESRDFEKSAAQSISTVLMQQAKIDGVNVYTLLDTLKGVDDIQISAIVAQVLNYNRQKVSSLGFTSDKIAREESRNIVV